MKPILSTLSILWIPLVIATVSCKTKQVEVKEWPSFGWMIKNGATTLPEGYKFTAYNMHHFMGAVDNFFYRHMLGINSDPSNSGFQNIILKPNFIKTMDFAKASYNSIHREIKAEWNKLNTNTYKYKIVIPANCKAQVILPKQKQVVKSGEHVFNVGL
jgi:alpha-L-rhamnosidase